MRRGKKIALRAREIPKCLFLYLVRVFGHNPKVIGTAAGKTEVIFLQRHNAVVGCLVYRNEQGTFSQLKLWEFEFSGEWDMSNVCRTVIHQEPLLKITGGPFPNGQWERGRGRKMVEEVRISYGSECLRGMSADNLCMKVAISISSDAVCILTHRKLPKISYWEAFQNPTANYTEPPG